MTHLWTFICNNWGLLLCCWAFIGHFYWLKAGYLCFNNLISPPKRVLMAQELAAMLVFWLMGPLTRLSCYALLLMPGVAWSYGLHYRYDD